MRAVSLLVVITLMAGPAVAQQRGPIGASIDNAARAPAEQTATRSTRGEASAGKGGLFWSGLVLGVAGITTSALGLTALRTEDTSTGNAPAGAYQGCVALKSSTPLYANSQCDALKGKNLKLLWGGVALSGVGAALMIRGSHTSAEISSTAIGLFHHWTF